MKRAQMLKAKSLAVKYDKTIEEICMLFEDLGIISYTSQPSVLLRKIVREYKAKTGRPKVRNDNQIRSLRKQGLTMREIAQQSGHSLMQVQRALK